MNLLIPLFLVPSRSVAADSWPVVFVDAVHAEKHMRLVIALVAMNVGFMNGHIDNRLLPRQ
jgi:hypothetical protein